MTLVCAAFGAGSALGQSVPAPTSATAVSSNSAAAPLRLPANYQLVWADEFDKPGLPDASKWVYDVGLNKQGWHNAELQYYGLARPKNSVVRGGKLFITARKESLRGTPDWGGQPYTSARLITRGKAQWTYGFFEARAKLPCGKGSWPAIWTLGAQGNWPAGGELDILEHMGQRPDWVFSTVHTTSGSAGQGRGDGRSLTTACGRFHSYQMWWTPNEVQFGVDGVRHYTYVNAKTGKDQWPFDAPQFLIINLAIGGHLGGPVDDRIFPLRFELDYVRVYQSKP